MDIDVNWVVSHYPIDVEDIVRLGEFCERMGVYHGDLENILERELSKDKDNKRRDDILIRLFYDEISDEFPARFIAEVEDLYKREYGEKGWDTPDNLMRILKTATANLFIEWSALKYGSVRSSLKWGSER